MIARVHFSQRTRRVWRVPRLKALLRASRLYQPRAEGPVGFTGGKVPQDGPARPENLIKPYIASGTSAGSQLAPAHQQG